LTPDSRKLLVVDDDANNRDMLSRRLTRRGFAVEVAENGQEALEKIEAAQYDLVLLDQMMPGMSGLDLLRLLRATYSQTDLPVIMVTAVDQSQCVVDALANGANDYVMKPVDMPVVTARIQAQLLRSRADRENKRVDALTGLGNRVQLVERITACVARQSKDAPGFIGVLLLDLDGFKVMNDSFGHHAGDQLLMEIGARLKSLAGPMGDSNSVARIGGDEFAMVLEDVGSMEQLEERAEAILASLRYPVEIQGRSLSSSASLGIAISLDGSCPAEELLRDADLAMYRAKELGKNRFEIFDRALRDRAQARMAIAMDLRHAIDRNQLVGFYQPKINLATRQIIGYEALLSWQHPERGLVPPNDFISIAEETGLINAIGEWILNEACRQLLVWQTKYPCSPPLAMNVNLSVKQLSDPDLLNQVKRILDETGIPPESLKLELTESSLMSEIESAREVLTSLQALHVGLKLDDFGTGYSSLSYLRTLHFDSLKIDQSFVRRLATDRETHAIVETIVNLAHALQMNVVAEGIETEDQLAELIDIGCESGQGFLFSRPVSSEAIDELLATRFAL
jgi:diguanylate cyclase (GGDEF)-like protein